VKFIRIHVYEYIEQILASNLPYRDRNPKYMSRFSKQKWRWWQAMATNTISLLCALVLPPTIAPHPISLLCALLLPPTSHRDATMPSPCWAPHFMIQEHLMISNPTPSKLHRSPAATMSDDMLSAPTPPLNHVSILQPATPPQVVAYESWTISAPICLNRFTLSESWEFDLWTCACVCVCLPLPVLPLLFW